ncbi:13484_t:CDS:1, partial [Gigaspora rosea]
MVIRVEHKELKTMPKPGSLIPKQAKPKVISIKYRESEVNTQNRKLNTKFKTHLKKE